MTTPTIAEMREAVLLAVGAYRTDEPLHGRLLAAAIQLERCERAITALKTGNYCDGDFRADAALAILEGSDAKIP